MLLIILSKMKIHINHPI